MNRAATLVVVGLAYGCAPEPLPGPAKTAPSHAPVPATWAPSERTQTGDPTPRAFERYSEARAGEFRGCWPGSPPQDPGRRGEITARLTVLPSGLVDDVEVGAPHDALASCIAGVIRTWRTPFRPAAPVSMVVPITVPAER